MFKELLYILKKVLLLAAGIAFFYGFIYMLCLIANVFMYS